MKEHRQRQRRSTGSREPTQSLQEVTTSNEYVLNVAFVSFFTFMVTQAVFATMAKSQSLLADSMAMSVDAFTYLFNLAAEKLKHRSNISDEDGNLPMEERRRRKKMIRLYLELIPPAVSVTALTYVSLQALSEAIATLTNPLQISPEFPDGDQPNVHVMLFFSILNLGLDIMNVSCFSKIQDFSIIGDGHMIEEPELGWDIDEEIAIYDPKKRSFPPSIIVNNSMDSSFDSYDAANESDGLLGVPSPNYGSPDNYYKWSENFSLDAVFGDNESDGLALKGLSVTIETGDSNSAYSNTKSIRKALLISPEELGGILEGDENSASDDDDLSQFENSYSDDDDNDSEKSGRGFNLNMCSAYTHVMADTLRSIAVLVAAALSSVFKNISPTLADATASVVVSIVIAASLVPLIVGLVKTWGELQCLRAENKTV